MNLKEPKKKPPSKSKGRGVHLRDKPANMEDDNKPKILKKKQQKNQRTLKVSNSATVNNTPPKSDDSSKCESLSDSLDFVHQELISPTADSHIQKSPKVIEEKENQHASKIGKNKLQLRKKRKIIPDKQIENESQKTELEPPVPVQEPTSVLSSAPNPLSSLEVNKDDESSSFTVGDIAWAYMPGYPLWPAIVTTNEDEGVHIKSKSFGVKEKPLIHVEFFGDKGSHSWLTTQSLFPYTDDLEQLKKDKAFVQSSKTQMKVTKAKRRMLASIQKAIKGERNNWQTAFDEAKQCHALPKEQRVEFIHELVREKIERNRRKRKVDSHAQSTTQPQRAKRSRSVKEDMDVEDSIPTPSPTPTPILTPTPPPSEDAEIDESTPTEASQVHHSIGNKRKRRLEKKKDPVCDQCGIRGDIPLLPCQKCRLLYHAQCCNSAIETETDSATLLCPHCQPIDNPSCFLCKQTTNVEVVRCTIKTCGRSYHLACLKSFHSSGTHGQVTSSKDSNLICPVHYCQTCVADLHNAHHPHKKLIRCIKCPTAYHSSEICLGAGCVRLSLTQMICSKHVESEGHSGGKRKNPIHVNANWCFLCSEGGRLICCERCPASFHTHCLNMDREPEGSYICYECIIGKTILYGDLVWVKIGVYRWWPARVFPPDEIPVQFHDRFAEASPGEFLVQFYGSHDFAFVHRGQAFLYQEGDRGTKDKSKRTLAVRYQAALDEAQTAFQERQLALAELTAERQAQVNTKPPPYIRIRSNKAVGKARIYESHSRSSPAICECNPKQDHPCGPDSECLNRILLIECDPSCPAGTRCENQRFQKRLYPLLYAFNAGGKGWGLKAQVDIKKGDFVIEYVGEVIDQEEFLYRLKAKQDAQDESYYFLTLDQTRVIDAGPRGNLARFMNHSCQPNCETQKWTVLGDTRVGLFAVEDIPAETELTFNYYLECAQDVVDDTTAKTRQQPCHCGAPNCSGFIGAKATKANNKNRIAGSGEEPQNGKGSKRGKKRKASRRAVDRQQAEDSCFRCTEGGRVIMCDVKTCSKVYHLECLNLTTTPKGKWECPWHHCDVCGRRASVFCSICPNSFCPAHSNESSTQSHPQLGPLCNEHTQEDMNFFIKRLSGAANEDKAARDQDQ